VTVVYLVQSVAAAAYAIQRDLRGEPFGMSTPFGIGTDFLIGWGTAISPGLPLYILAIVSLALTWRHAAARNARVALGLLGALMFLGHLCERIVWTGFAGDPRVVVPPRWVAHRTVSWKARE